jgi:hypothetical protein
MKKYYAGIGSRKTPVNVLEIMTRVACALELDGWTLRSGGANGADTAFERGVNDPQKKQIFLPWKGFNGKSSIFYEPCADAMEMAEQFHPNWNACNSYARKFHARNCYQVLGPSLEQPVKFIVCWTPGAKVTGGTGQALRIAQHHNIEICNMADPAVLERIERYIKEKKDEV